MSENDKKDLNNDLNLNKEGQPLNENEGELISEDAALATTEDNAPQDTTAAETVVAAPNTNNAGSEGPRKTSGTLGWMITSLVLAILLVVVLIKPPFAGSSNEAVATVNGEKITKDELYDTLVQSGGASALDNLISDKLVAQDAKAKNVTITEQDIDNEIASIKEEIGSDEQLNAALQQYGMTMDDLRAQMKTQATIRKILGPEAKVTDEQIKQYFDENKASFDTPEQVEASHILVATEQEAKDIITQLNNGADFAALAKEKSTDTSNSADGGALGYFGKGEMDPAFESAAFAMKVGETSKEPVKTSFGYHIIKVTGHKDAKVATLDEVKDKIKSQLEEQAIVDMHPKWLADLKAKATITNTLDKTAAPSGSTE